MGHTTTTTFDKDNRVVAVTDPLGHTTTTVYDAAGNAVQSIDPLGNITTAVFDALNQHIATIDPLGHTTSVVLDGNGQSVASIDPLGHVKESVRDAAGRPGVVQLDARGGVGQTLYDAAGNVAAVIDADGNVTTYLYDALNRDIRHWDSFGTVTTVYNSAGLVSSVTDADSRTITYSYDAINEETGETWKSSSNVVVNTLTFSYDKVGNELTAANSAGTYTLGYDALNRTTTQTDPWGLTLTYSYDAADRLTLRQDSKGGTLTSVYDNADRLTSRQLSASSQTLRIDPGYNNRDDMTSLTRYADIAGTQLLGTTTYGIDSADRLTSIVNKNATSATLSYYNYAYDNNDRVTSETWNSQVGTVVYSGTHTYTYDATDQLLSDSTTTYTYDLNGNRTMSGYQTGTGNRLSTDGTWTYTYDNAGNQVTKANSSGTTWTYGYDNLNHLTSATETINGVTSLVASYTYDVFGNLLQEQHWTAATGTVTLRHAYDGSEAWADLDTSNNVKVCYVYGDDGTIWVRMVPSGQTNAGVAWYLTDRLGSVTDLMDGTQAMKDHLDYTGYGVVTESNASFGDANKYAGGRTDSATGLVQFGWRWYNPTMGQWTSQDPIGFSSGDDNLYRYVMNDPINTIDLNGTIASEPPGVPRPNKPILSATTWQSSVSVWTLKNNPAHVVQNTIRSIDGDMKELTRYHDGLNSTISWAEAKKRAALNDADYYDRLSKDEQLYNPVQRRQFAADAAAKRQEAQRWENVINNAKKEQKDARAQIQNYQNTLDEIKKLKPGLNYPQPYQVTYPTPGTPEIAEGGGSPEEKKKEQDAIREKVLKDIEKAEKEMAERAAKAEKRYDEMIKEIQRRMMEGIPPPPSK